MNCTTYLLLWYIVTQMSHLLKEAAICRSCHLYGGFMLDITLLSYPVPTTTIPHSVIYLQTYGESSSKLNIFVF